MSRIYKPRRITTRSIFDIKTGRLVRRDGYDYSGPMALATAMASYDQTAYAFYNDDGSESTATIIGTQDTQQSIPVDTIFHIRIRVEDTGGAAGNLDGKKFEFDHNSAGFVELTTSSSVIQAVDSSNLTQDDDTTRRLGGAKTYDTTNAWVTEDGGLADNSMDASNEVEALLAAKIIGADVSDTDEIIVRISGLNSYTVAGADIDVDKPAGAPRRFFVID